MATANSLMPVGPSRTPKALIIREARADPQAPTWRAKVHRLPELAVASLRPAQVTAIQGLEKSSAEQHFDRSLIQMATGAGKTYTAVTEVYRLLKFGGFRRILYLVDRNTLADQTMVKFQNYRTPGDGQRFTEIYKLTAAFAEFEVVASASEQQLKARDSDLLGNWPGP